MTRRRAPSVSGPSSAASAGRPVAITVSQSRTIAADTACTSARSVLSPSAP
jgi:hypothetical protein